MSVGKTVEELGYMPQTQTLYQTGKYNPCHLFSALGSDSTLLDHENPLYFPTQQYMYMYWIQYEHLWLKCWLNLAQWIQHVLDSTFILSMLRETNISFFFWKYTEIKLQQTVFFPLLFLLNFVSVYQVIQLHNRIACSSVCTCLSVASASETSRAHTSRDTARYQRRCLPKYLLMVTSLVILPKISPYLWRQSPVHTEPAPAPWKALC